MSQTYDRPAVAQQSAPTSAAARDAWSADTAPLAAAQRAPGGGNAFTRALLAGLDRDADLPLLTADAARVWDWVMGEEELASASPALEEPVSLFDGATDLLGATADLTRGRIGGHQDALALLDRGWHGAAGLVERAEGAVTGAAGSAADLADGVPILDPLAHHLADGVSFHAQAATGIAKSGADAATGMASLLLDPVGVGLGCMSLWERLPTGAPNGARMIRAAADLSQGELSWDGALQAVLPPVFDEDANAFVGQLARAGVDAVAEPLREGRSGELAGRLIFEAAALAVPGGPATRAGKAAKIAEGAGDLASVGRVAGHADDLASAQRALPAAAVDGASALATGVTAKSVQAATAAAIERARAMFPDVPGLGEAFGQNTKLLSREEHAARVADRLVNERRVASREEGLATAESLPAYFDEQTGGMVLNESLDPSYLDELVQHELFHTVAGEGLRRQSTAPLNEALTQWLTEGALKRDVRGYADHLVVAKEMEEILGAEALRALYAQGDAPSLWARIEAVEPGLASKLQDDLGAAHLKLFGQ